MAIDAAQLTKMSQAQLDDLFRHAGVDRVPEGDADGTAILLPGTRLSGAAAALIRLLVWQGKVVEPGGGRLRNKVSPLRIKAIPASVYTDTSRFDGNACIVLDYSKTSLVARWIRDEIREVSPGRFLGLVYWGKRRLANFFLDFPG